MKKGEQVVVVQEPGPSWSEHSSLLTPHLASSRARARGLFGAPKQPKQPFSTSTRAPRTSSDIQGRLYVAVHRANIIHNADVQKSPKTRSLREYKPCNNKFHKCHHRRYHREPRDRKNVTFDLLKPAETPSPNPLTAKSRTRDQGSLQRHEGKGQGTKDTGSGSHVGLQDGWPPGGGNDVKDNSQSPFVSGGPYNIPDTNQEYIPIKMEDYPSSSDGGVMSTTSRQLTMLTALKDRANCLGGWSFLVLALGAVVFLPATLFTGLYLKHTANPLRIIGLSFFSLSILLISIGIGICIVWMRFSSDNRSRPGSPVKAPFQKDLAKESINTVPEPSAEEYELGMANDSRKEEIAVFPSTSKEDGWSEGQSESLPLSVV